MNKKTNNSVIAVIVLLVVILLVWLWYSQRSGRQTAQTPKQTQTAGATIPQPLAVQTTPVPNNKLPDGFPADIPLEKGAQITQNYTAQAGGVSQATRVWVTGKTLDQNFQIYQSFFSNSKNGWTIQNTVNQPNLKSITASKGKVQAIVNINENTVSKQQTVSITASWSS